MFQRRLNDAGLFRDEERDNLYGAKPTIFRFPFSLLLGLILILIHFKDSFWSNDSKEAAYIAYSSKYLTIT